MKHLSGCNAGNFGACTCHEIRSARIGKVNAAANQVLVVEAGSAGASRFMSRIMSNLDGEKDAKISHLQSRIDELEAALKGLMRVCPPERDGMKLREYEAARAAMGRKGYSVSRPPQNSEAK